MAAREKPDLILLDVRMPVMDGVAMLGTLRRDPGLKGTPVIMLTAESSREDVASAEQLGISGYLVKPFNEQALMERVRRVVPLLAKTA